MLTLAANAVVIDDDGKVLLTKRTDFEVWCLPSGAVEEGESVAQAAIRETREETGLDVALTRLVGVYSRLGALPDVHAVVFAARAVGGSIRTQPDETLDVRWFAPNALPRELSFGHRQRIVDALAGEGGVAWVQRIPATMGRPLTRPEMYAMRDESSLSKSEFYARLVGAPGPEDQVLEVRDGGA